jgi:hypothetical protein
VALIGRVYALAVLDVQKDACARRPHSRDPLNASKPL